MISMLTSALVASKVRRGSGRITRQPLLWTVCVSAALAMAATVATRAMAYTPVDIETFNMPDGQLVGQTPGFTTTDPNYPTWCAPYDPWNPSFTAAGSEISVVTQGTSHLVQIGSHSSGNTTMARWIRYDNFVPSPDIVVFQFWARKGSYTGSDVTSWHLGCGMASESFNSDRSFGKFSGNSSSITMYDPTWPDDPDHHPVHTEPLTDQWKCFTAVGDDTSAYTYYYVGNANVFWGSCWATVNPKVHWIRMESYATGSNSSYAYLGNFSYGYALTRDEQPVMMTPPPDAPVAPGPVTGFAAVGFNGQVAMSWSNPASWNFHGTMIRFKTTGYPTSVTDGTLLIDQPGLAGSAAGYVHSGLTNGVTYYYSAFTHDLAAPGPNYSTKVDASGTPSIADCWNESFMYPNGPLAGNGIWTAACDAVTVDNQTVRIVGDGAPCNCTANVTCRGRNGIILVSARVKAGAGSDNMWHFWINDAAGNNFARWYGSGTTAKPRIGGTSIVLDSVTLTGGWDTLEVEIDTNTNYSYFYFNGTLLGGLSYSSTGAGNTIGNVWLGRQNTTAPGQYVWFDNIVMGGAVDPVSNLTATPGLWQVSLTWTNPDSAGFTGTMIRYKATGYPTGPTDGTLLIDKANTPGSSDLFVHTGLDAGVRVYYAAFAHDATTWSDPVTISEVPRGLGDYDHDGDVDQEDFGHLQACLSGSGTSCLPECADADFDGDSDVDNDDFNAFQPCISGPNQASGC
jgi:hypothetical protein